MPFGIMTLRDRISLTWRYGKGIFLIGAVYNLVCAGSQTLGFSYTFMVDSFILKVALLAITMYLVKQFRDRDAISSVADNLFVIADGYTSPVRSREDLVRHGYLRAEDLFT